MLGGSELLQVPPLNLATQCSREGQERSCQLYPGVHGLLYLNVTHGDRTVWPIMSSSTSGPPDKGTQHMHHSGGGGDRYEEPYDDREDVDVDSFSTPYHNLSVS